MNYTIKHLLDAYNNGVTEGMNVALNEYIARLKDAIFNTKIENEQQITELIDSTAKEYVEAKNGTA